MAASEWDAQALRELSIEVPGTAPGGASWRSAVIDMRAFYAGRLYELGGGQGATFALVKGGSLNRSEYRLQLAHALNQVHYSPQFRTASNSADGRTMLRQAINDSLLPMIAYGLGGEGLGHDWLAPPDDPGRVTVFMLIEQPQELDTSTHVATHGGMVYRFDLPLSARNSP